jgi:hypothetical protein
MLHLNTDSNAPASANGMSKEAETELLVSEINKFLSAPPRYEGDMAVVLTMPESYLKKARAKLNEAIHVVYDRYKDYGVTMLTILCSIESVVESAKLGPFVDNDIKLMIAADKGIEISVDELDRVNEQLRRGELNLDSPRTHPRQPEPEEDEDAEFTAMMDMVGEDDDEE